MASPFIRCWLYDHNILTKNLSFPVAWAGFKCRKKKIQIASREHGLIIDPPFIFRRHCRIPGPLLLSPRLFYTRTWGYTNENMNQRLVVLSLAPCWRIRTESVGKTHRRSQSPTFYTQKFNWNRHIVYKIASNLEPNIKWLLPVRWRSINSLGVARDRCKITWFANPKSNLGQALQSLCCC